ncbi:response regulator [Pseudoroseicyclus tamaricis]|uniref:Response regulator n=1 Tax=Pseudoroseicyclus tamaricis TaxID=2705421 RepID=A0A6B2JS37_9RHOB|nr:response regulator [Pseudoroseicyclus tamaricis]NDV01028.1 response regulator [Pseudoroseicyclus tamaricis]
MSLSPLPSPTTVPQLRPFDGLPTSKAAPPLRLVATGADRPMRLRVLVLDDDEVDRIRIARLLGHAEGVVETEFVASLEEFRAALDEDRVDIAILDYSLPEGTGLDAIHDLRRHPRQERARPIVVAGDCQAEIAVAAMKAGSCDCIDKQGLTVQRLRQAIAEALAAPGYPAPPVGEETLQAVLDAMDRLCLSQLRPTVGLLSRLVAELHETGADADARELALQEMSAALASLDDVVHAFSAEVTARGGGVG